MIDEKTIKAVESELEKLKWRDVLAIDKTVGKTRICGLYTILTGPKSQNYGAAVDATHAKKAKL